VSPAARSDHYATVYGEARQIAAQLHRAWVSVARTNSPGSDAYERAKRAWEHAYHNETMAHEALERAIRAEATEKARAA